MKLKVCFSLFAIIAIVAGLTACRQSNEQVSEETQENASMETITENTTVGEIIADPVFGDFGRLLFPVDRQVSENATLADISSSSVYVWYSEIKKEKTVEILNTLKQQAENGQKIFYDIYTQEEMDEDPSKQDTGLFFFKGNPGAEFAIMNAGGGFAYVGAMHDSFPHALEVSKKGYNSFALIYRPDYAYEDLAQAISYIYDNAEELEVNPAEYSLWGGSAGARMAAALGNNDYLQQLTGRSDIPQAAAVIMQYTGYTTVSPEDAPTYACVGTRDGIASWETMERRLSQLDAYGIPTEFHSYDGLGHGFGLGTDTVAEGWIDDAVAFWEAQMKGTSTEVSKDIPQLSSEEYRGFSVDNVLQSQEGDIHYNIYLPDSYDGSKPYALYITLPGYQGLYFQGVAQNIKTEDFGFEAQNYNEEMIILAPQLFDWGETSAKQTIALTEYFLENYNIDASKVYISGYSGGGETLSLVLDENPELYTAALLCSSQWDGGYAKVAETKTPVYLVIGEDDEYYSSQPFKDAYEELNKAYEDQGLSETEISQLLVLDVKDQSYFDAGGIEYQHGGGYLFARDEAIMGWLFSK